MKRLKPHNRKDRFARDVIKRLRRSGESRSIEYDRRNFQLIIGGRDRSYLSNIYEIYENCQLLSGDAREAILNRYVGAPSLVDTVASLDSFDDAKANILPLLHSRAELSLDLLKVQCGAMPVARPFHPVAEHLGVAIVYNTPDCFVYIGDDRLKKWGVSFTDAMITARQNLLTYTKSEFISPSPGLHVSNTRDDLDATRLLLTEEIGKLPVKGDCTALPANRGIFIVTGSDDAEGLTEMARITDEWCQGPHPVAPLPLRLNGQEWHPWYPGKSHPQYEAFRSLELQYWQKIYLTQKKLLEEYAGEDDDSHCAAAFMVAQRPDDNQSFGVAFWISSLTPTSLPKADAISFWKHGEVCVKPDGTFDFADLFDVDICLVEWDAAVEILDDFIQEEGTYPVRYRVEEFPSGAEWEKLKKIAWK